MMDFSSKWNEDQFYFLFPPPSIFIYFLFLLPPEPYLYIRKLNKNYIYINKAEPWVLLCQVFHRANLNSSGSNYVEVCFAWKGKFLYSPKTLGSSSRWKTHLKLHSVSQRPEVRDMRWWFPPKAILAPVLLVFLLTPQTQETLPYWKAYYLSKSGFASQRVW